MSDEATPERPYPWGRTKLIATLVWHPHFGVDDCALDESGVTIAQFFSSKVKPFLGGHRRNRAYCTMKSLWGITNPRTAIAADDMIPS